MYTDPQTITISAVPISLPRTSTEGDEALYTSADGLVQLAVSHESGKNGRMRHAIRVNHNKMTTDPFIPTTNVKVGMSTYVVFDVPAAGYTVADQKAIWDGFTALLAASSAVAITKLLAGES
jgi:hypothetical protein